MKRPRITIPPRSHPDPDRKDCPIFLTGFVGIRPLPGEIMISRPRFGKTKPRLCLPQERAIGILFH